MDRTVAIAKTILTELESFAVNFEMPTYSGASSDAVAKRSHAAYDSEKWLAVEPFIVYAKVYEREGNAGEWAERIYFVNRYTTPLRVKPAAENGLFCSRNSPVGRVASLDVGEEFSVKLQRKVKHIELIEKGIFKPHKGKVWDAVSSVVYAEELREQIGSLREFLSTLGEDDPADGEVDASAFVDAMDEEARRRADALQQERRRRRKRQARAIAQLALRDQPALDSKQDLFCRLPIDAKAILIGPPGTGKTTTLIKRLALVLDPRSRDEDEELTPDEKARYYRSEPNWYLYTPSELLRTYLTESLGKESLPASSEYVRLWSVDRSKLARDVFRIVKGIDRGVFKRARSRTLPESDGPGLLALSDRFLVAVGESYRSAARRALELLEAAEPVAKERAGADVIESLDALAAGVRKAVARTKPVTTDPDSRDIVSTVRILSNLRTRTRDVRRGADELLQSIANEIIIANPAAIDEIVRTGGVEGSGDDESGRALDARDSIKRAVLALGRRIARKGQMGKRANPSPAEAIVRLRADDADFRERLRLLGLLRELADTLAPIVRGYRGLLDSLAVRYERYREETAETDALFAKHQLSATIKARTIGDDETDVLVYVMLMVARQIFRANPEWLENSSRIDVLESLKEWYRAHIAIDEASDFSLVQIGCLMHLAHPAGGSVTLSGDLMQRMTLEGITSWDECRQLSRGFEVRELETPYRQSPALHAVARKLHELQYGSAFGVAIPAEEDDPRPLRFQSEDREDAAHWIAERIAEIYKIHDDRMVSIAIFVADDDDINETYELLCEPLGEYAIEIQKCHEGRVLGEGSYVRIFSVKYIKGLEFEAVFFMDIDRVSERVPELVDKYLYVGLTRAGNFLGVTSANGFPATLKPLEAEFDAGTWKDFLSR